MASESSGRTFQEYLAHHLQNLVYGPLPEGHERKFYAKGDSSTEKDTYCQDKGMDYDGSKYCKETLTEDGWYLCLLYTSPSPRDRTRSRMPSSA